MNTSKHAVAAAIFADWLVHGDPDYLRLRIQALRDALPQIHFGREEHEAALKMIEDRMELMEYMTTDDPNVIPLRRAFMRVTPPAA